MGLSNISFSPSRSVNIVKHIRDRLRKISDPIIAEHSKRFFKTGPGEYGENDQFLGIRVPILRKEVRKFHRQISHQDILVFLVSCFHEERLLALLMMVEKYHKGNMREKKTIFTMYIRYLKYINNWDLVDSSSHYIIGAHLESSGRTLLYRYAKSKNLWKRRIAIIATYWFIKKGDFKDALNISQILLTDEHDLIHKAVGWMLREIGRRDLSKEKEFLNQYTPTMPRTMLRYAIEKFPETERQKYLHIKKKVIE